MRISIFLILCCLFLSCNPQESTEVNLNYDGQDSIPSFSKRGPNLMISKKDHSSPLQISKLKVSTEIIGSIAVTTMDMTFYNDSNQVLSGELYFPLNDGQTISRFALEVNGKMRDAVPVEKQKGRVAYESTVRKGIDPGLAEITKGNNFRTRIYPINAKASKRVIIAYEQKLTRFKGNDYYRLPLYFNEKIKEFQWEVQVLNDEIPSLESGSFSNFSFEKWEDVFKAEHSEEDFRANQELRVLIPKNGRDEKAIVEKGENGHFFYLNLPIESQSKPRSISRKNLTIVWDASHSGRKRDSKKEIEFLNQYLHQNQFKGFRLLGFSNSVFLDENFNSVEKLLKKIKSIPFDGASNIGLLPWDNFKSDEVLIFSDLISSIGNSSIPIPNKPCFVINSSPGSDYVLQNFITRKSGAKRIDLSKTTVSSALEQIQNIGFQLIEIEVLEGEAKEIYPRKGAPIDPGFSISGISMKEKLKLKLRFSFGEAEMKELIVDINLMDAYSGKSLAEKLWAQMKIEELSLEAQRNKIKISELSKEFGIVTENTSLIVLDNVADYVLHEIVPPLELQEEYFNSLDKISTNKKKLKHNHHTSVVKLWKQRIAWWERNYIRKKKKGLLSTPDSTRNLPNSLRSNNRNAGNSNELAEVSFATTSDGYYALDVRLDDNNNPGSSFGTDANQNIEKNQTKIKINKWEPNNKEFLLLSAKTPRQSYAYYLSLKDSNEMNAVFYSDAARVFMKNEMKSTAKLVLSNLSELQYDDHEMLKVWANTLMDWKEYEDAVLVYKEILYLRAEEPQSYRDLGLALYKLDQNQEAIETLYKVIEKNWDGRFPEIETIVLGEINAIIQQSKMKLETDFMDPQLLKNLPVDLRIIIDWDADNMDIDLWVTDPFGEKCFFSHPSTEIGGKMSRDFTRGYGPEEFLIKNALKGKYKVEVNYYGSSQQRVAGPPSIKARLISNFGKENETEKVISFRLEQSKEVLFIGEMIID